MKKEVKIIMLASDKESSRIMYNGLKKSLSITHVIIENPASQLTIITNKIKKFGLVSALGQFLFILLNSTQKRHSHKRIQKIKHQENLDSSQIPIEIVKNVESVNDKETIVLIKEYHPDIIIINGTRIIKKHILESTDAIFINTHMGITPKYRGVHGGYWALASQDKENCGITIHLVDKGIDTGNILKQDTISITKKDNFNTYPYLQIAKAIPLMTELIANYSKNEEIPSLKNNLSSKIWTHPTLFEYISNWILKKVR